MTTLFKIHENKLLPVQRKALASEEVLESWIAEDPAMIGLDVLLIGRQVATDFGGRIDLLAMDREGDLTVIELKRDRTPRDIVAQILDYASWISNLSTKRVHEIAMEKLGRRLEAAFLERFDAPLPENLNGNHSMVIVASEFDTSSKRIVEYLAEEHDVSINTTFFNVFEQDGEQLLATDWLLDQQQVSDRGDPVFVYQKQAGYVGYGTITQPAKLARDFEVNDEPLLEQKLVQPNLGHDRDDPEIAEYVVGVEWHRTYPIGEARTSTGAFANQNIICKLRDPATIEFLKREFDA